ncbi:hypothetical protein BSN85_22795 [Bradyrhizobium brasilense]|uniref:HEAT repeat domain-containing protein n=1 Tax=Bradyrhizobium brasilense TaxID=1419277 RepID=UPI0009763FA0|nr:HEAT repeat domain-containing protein [Bradyrhizobium brasilense]OMI06304.1 hypothetical protein BSN85_22795 [Bradyrhizobium brasilense]
MKNTPERQLQKLSLAARRLVKHLPTGQPPFKLAIGWATSYDAVFEEKFDTLTEKTVIDYALKRGRALITGRGGSGKTFLLHRLMDQAVKRGILPIMLDLKNWTGADYRDWDRWIANPNIAANFLIERFGRPQVSVLELDWVPPTADKLLFVDGLNEISATVGQQILLALNNFVAESIRCSVIVADRLVRRDLPSPDRWQIGVVQPLSRKKIEQYGGKALLKSRGAALLDLPFFLDAAIRSGGVSEGRAATHARYFAAHSGLNEAELDRVGKSAFEAYSITRTRTFEFNAFERSLGRDIVARLESNNIFIRLDQTMAQFAHHLQHDYLAARYLAAAGSECWTPGNLDIISFAASSFDSVSLVFEQIRAEDSDLFLRRVFDWNLYAAGYVLAETDPNDLRLSLEMQTVVLAMLAEKRFDLVEATRRRANDALALIRLPIAEEFRKAASIEQLFSAAKRADSEAPWFNQWRDAYTKPGSAFNSDEEVISVAEDNSILGWTLANVLKRTRVSLEQQAILRSMLTHTNDTVRWRVAHVLGSYPTIENLNALSNLAVEDPSGHVRYGAARSLAELACRADGELRAQVVRLVTANVPIFMQDRNQRVLKELADAFMVVPEQAPEHWYDVVTKIAREFYLRSEPIETRDRWRQYVMNAENRYTTSNRS